MIGDQRFRSPAIVPTKDDLKGTTKADFYVHPWERRRRRRAKIRAYERERGLPTTVPWQDELDGPLFKQIEAGA